MTRHGHFAAGMPSLLPSRLRGEEENTWFKKKYSRGKTRRLDRRTKKKRTSPFAAANEAKAKSIEELRIIREGRFRKKGQIGLRQESPDGGLGEETEGRTKLIRTAHNGLRATPRTKTADTN